MGNSNYLYTLDKKLWKETMEKFDTGAVRSSRMPRYDLIPRIVLERLAKRFTGEVIGPHEGDKWATGGALKYGECNWEKGLPTSDVINHIYDHLTRYVDRFRNFLRMNNGDMDKVRKDIVAYSEDDDLAGAMCGLAVLMYQEETGMFHDNNYKSPTKPTSPTKETSEAQIIGVAIDSANKRLDLVEGSWEPNDDKFLPKICSLCNIGNADAKIKHAIHIHCATYNMAKKS